MSDKPAIRMMDYMSSDSLDFVNIIGPYASAADRNRDLARLESLPLGRPEYRGGQEYQTATMADAVGELHWSLRIATPEQMAKATTQYGAHCALFGYDEEADEEAAQAEDDVHPDQIALDIRSRGDDLTERLDSMHLTPAETRDILVMLSGVAPDELEEGLNFIARMREMEGDVVTEQAKPAPAVCGEMLGLLPSPAERGDVVVTVECQGNVVDGRCSKCGARRR